MKKHSFFFLVNILFATSLSCNTVHMTERLKEENKLAVPYYQTKKIGGYNFNIGADYTLWFPYQEVPPILTQINPNSERGNVSYPKIGASSGFKIHGSYRTPHEHFIVLFQYTFFSNVSRFIDEELATDGSYVNYAGIEIITADGFSSQYKNFFQRIDLIAKKGLYIGYYTSFSPWIGFTFPWCDMQLNVNQTLDLATNQAVNSSFRQSWFGAGPYGGGRFIFFLTDDWGIYFTTGGAMLVTSLKEQLHQIKSQTNNERSTIGDVNPMIESTLGLSWDAVYPYVGITIRAGWEMQLYFNQLTFFENNQKSTFALQGFTFGLSALF